MPRIIDYSETVDTIQLGLFPELACEFRAYTAVALQLQISSLEGPKREDVVYYLSPIFLLTNNPAQNDPA